MIKNENLYAEEVLVESPFYYDSHGRLRVRVLGEESVRGANAGITLSPVSSKDDEDPEEKKLRDEFNKKNKDNMWAMDMPIDPDTGKPTSRRELAYKKFKQEKKTGSQNPPSPKPSDDKVPAGTGGPGAQITPAKPAVMPRNADDDAKISANSDKASPNKLTSVAKLVARRTEMNKNAKPVRPQPQVTGGPKLPMKTGISKTTIPPRGSLPVLGRPKVTNPAEKQKVIGKDALGHPVIINRQTQPTSPRTLPRTAAGGPALSLTERLNLKKTKMGDVIKDFQQSDAPQFKGKSQEKRRQMAIAAKLQADRG